MRRNVHLKSGLRQPIRSVLILLLISAVSFAFVSRAYEYVAVKSETERLAGYYRSIGYLTPTDSGAENVLEGANFIADSPYLRYEDRQRATSGILEGLYSANTDGHTGDFYPETHVSEIFFYGQLLFKYDSGQDSYLFRIQVDDIVVGFPEYAEVGKETILSLDWESNTPSPYDTMEVGERYLFKAVCTNDDWQQVKDGTGRLTMKPINAPESIWYMQVQPGETIDFQAVGLQDEIDLIHENTHTLIVYTSSDLSAKPRIQTVSDQEYLVEGRLLTRDDELNANPVCVIHYRFAQARGLSVGDMLTINLRDMQTPYTLIPDTMEDWREYPTHQLELEIVGTYGVFKKISVQPTARSATMYIPDSCMPLDFGNTPGNLHQSAYSFVLNSTKDQNAFIAENKKALEDMGYRLTFVETKAENFWASADPINQSSLLNVLVFSGVMVLVQVIILYLYLRQRRKDFAILRALGLPKTTSVGRMFAPVVTIWMPGVLIGGMIAWQYAAGKTAETISTLETPGYMKPFDSLSPLWLLGFCAAVAGLMLLFTLIGTLATSKRPVLELLQDAKAKGKRRD